MTRIVAILGAYGIASFLPIYFILQPFIKIYLPGLPITYGDLMDLLLTPWIGVGVFALLYVSIPSVSDSSVRHRNLYRLLFWIFSVLYVEGHGIHLAANSISNNVVAGTDPRLVHSIFLFDEPIGHLLWLGGGLGLALVAVAYQTSYTSREYLMRRQIWLILICGMLYGVGFALTIIEGGSALWAAPIVVGALAVMGYRWFRRHAELSKRPTWTFFLSGFTFLLVTLGVWFAGFGGFIEPSKFLQLGP
ncbi:MAG: hypothetical protein IIC78_11820 [Chloroflexi bacterium]|nr:hypothetical protein [Chloroflexota bacterium]